MKYTNTNKHEDTRCLTFWQSSTINKFLLLLPPPHAPPPGDDGQDDDVDIDDYDDEDIGIDDADSLAASGVDRGAGGLGGGSGGSGVGGGGGGGGGNKGRRRRTAFTSEQLLELEKEFHAKKYLSLTERSQIAHTLKLSEVQVQSAFV